MPVTAKETSTDRAMWFDEIVSTLRTHETMMDSGIADKTIELFYNSMIKGSMDDVMQMSRKAYQQYFISQIIAEYSSYLKEYKPVKFAFDYNDSEVLVCAEIKDDDIQAEKTLILAEAKVNAKFHGFGYDIVTTIVETGDELPVPNHYITV